ncbi:hypothetical protein E7Z59_04925 [Robertkochia marina]|uniref:Uncharacterized protein n=1 Tax=Robertkochia marina TaxID=1227945 RepID=A0A4S3M3D6_9FLAO|nr:hypothetical protein [Robertkochia marina]THD69672.1 hypothetical protein E7Z59_04925 [Robertkochia marina]TRZ46982.1 hypothetical protein D3A96_05295 [Robertkochia marina]
MNNILLMEVCKKVYHKNLQRDLCTLIKPTYKLSHEFVFKSLTKSRNICRMILQDLLIETGDSYTLEDKDIDWIISRAFQEVQQTYLQAN